MPYNHHLCGTPGEGKDEETAQLLAGAARGQPPPPAEQQQQHQPPLPPKRPKSAVVKSKAPKPEIGRLQMARRAFSFVWPETGGLKARLAVCALLVLLERIVNLAVPVLYKHMVDQLSRVATMLLLEAATSRVPALAAVAAHLKVCSYTASQGQRKSLKGSTG